MSEFFKTHSKLRTAFAVAAAVGVAAVVGAGLAGAGIALGLGTTATLIALEASKGVMQLVILTELAGTCVVASQLGEKAAWRAYDYTQERLKA